MTENEKQNPETKPKVKKEYDGSRKPMLIVMHYKSSNAVKNAQVRLRKRFEWIKKRNEEIKQSYSDPNTDALVKLELLKENKALSVEVPKLMVSQKDLGAKYEELEQSAIEEVKNATLKPINLDGIG